jgi:hypothetical protein
MADWGQVALVLSSAGVTLGAVELTQRRESRRERDARAEERRAAIADRQAERAAIAADRRAAFEQDTLLALQDALAILGRVDGEWHYRTTAYYRKQEGHPLAYEPEPPTLSKAERDQRELDANRTVRALRVRVLDVRVRQAVERYHARSSASALVNSVEDVERSQAACLAAYDDAMEEIGRRLRELYGESA